LLDCYHPAGRSDSFFAIVDTAKSRLVLFTPSRPWEDGQEIARRPQVMAFVHPQPGKSLTELLRAALGT
jgi:hypothetical protein